MREESECESVSYKAVLFVWDLLTAACAVLSAWLMDYLCCV